MPTMCIRVAVLGSDLPSTIHACTMPFGDDSSEFLCCHATMTPFSCSVNSKVKSSVIFSDNTCRFTCLLSSQTENWWFDVQIVCRYFISIQHISNRQELIATHKKILIDFFPNDQIPPKLFSSSNSTILMEIWFNTVPFSCWCEWFFFSSKYYFANIIILRPNWWDGGDKGGR